MSSLFNCTLHLGPSADYRKLIGLLALVSSSAVLLSGYPVWIKFPCLLILGTGLYREWRNACPESGYKQLHLMPGRGILTAADNLQQEFTKYRVLMDTGLFFLLALSTETSRKVLVIFFDQLEGDQWRQVNCLEKRMESRK